MPYFMHCSFDYNGSYQHGILHPILHPIVQRMHFAHQKEKDVHTEIRNNLYSLAGKLYLMIK